MCKQLDGVKSDKTNNKAFTEFSTTAKKNKIFSIESFIYLRRQYKS